MTDSVRNNENGLVGCALLSLKRKQTRTQLYVASNAWFDAPALPQALPECLRVLLCWKGVNTSHESSPLARAATHQMSSLFTYQVTCMHLVTRALYDACTSRRCCGSLPGLHVTCRNRSSRPGWVPSPSPLRDRGGSVHRTASLSGSAARGWLDSMHRAAG